VHTAGVLDDATVGSLDAGRLDAVRRPKFDAAVHLHELTSGLDLSMFVLYSSFAGRFGTAGQGNYAAANAAVDALAARRAASGLPAVSLAWGWWDEDSGMTGHLGAGDRARMRRDGLAPMPSELGMELFDRALRLGLPTAVPALLRPQGTESELPALLRGLDRPVGAPTRARRAPNAAAPTGTTLAARLPGLDPADRVRAVLDAVLGEVASVLGHADPEAVGVRQAFKDLGFDSLTAVELRNRLNTLTGQRLPATLVFDHPNPEQLASYLVERIGPADPPRQDASTARGHLRQLELLLLADPAPSGADERELIRTELADLLTRAARQATVPDSAADLDDASDEELFALVDDRG